MEIKVNGIEVEQVKHFKYLGSLFTDDGRSQKEIEARIAIATSALTRTKSIWKDHNVTIKSKCRLLRALVASCFLYGCETWTLTLGLEKRISAFELRCYRRLLNIPYTAHRTNAAVLEEIRSYIGSFDRLLEIVKRRKMTWYGHVQRAQNLATVTMQGKVNGRRARGRPRRTWIKDVQDWTNLGMEGLTAAARDRGRWRRVAYEASKIGAPTIATVTG